MATPARPTAVGQKPPNSHQGWTGVFTVRVVERTTIDLPALPAKATRGTWDQMTRVTFNPDGSVTGNYRSQNEQTSTVRGDTSTQTVYELDRNEGDGLATGDATVHMDADGSYEIITYGLLLPAPGFAYTKVTNSVEGTTVSNDDHPNSMGTYNVTGKTTSGSNTIQGKSVGTHTEPREGGAVVTTTEMSWSLSRAETLAVTVSIENYEDWWPQAGPSEDAPGNTLHVHARLQHRDGSPADEKAVFTFDLLDTSAVPGICINFPKRAQPQPKKDLRLDAEANATSNVGSEGQTATTKTPGLEAEAVISSYDWGGYGAVRVTATIGDRKIIGYLEADGSQPEIRIPKRTAGSRIADYWKRLNDVDSTAKDIDDVDEVPKSQVLDGDGLSLYEEYRGFYENGRHVRGNPHVKDLFVRDHAGPSAEPGFALLAEISDMDVHHQITDDEMREDRVINFNNEINTHAVDQHALALFLSPTAGDSFSSGKQRCPFETTRTEVVPENVAIRGVVGQRREFAAAVAHELLHGCGVDHHSDAEHEDFPYAVWKKNGPGLYTETADGFGTPITIVAANGTPLTDDQIAGRFLTAFPNQLYVATERGGEHSGAEECVMRYDCNDAYTKGDHRTIIHGREAPGTSLCSSRAGTGINAHGGTPDTSRHGDASRGNCKAQICVNDKRAQQQ